ncbi:MAG: YciI-like protein [Thermodesulfobacteriota bacterium]
MRIFVLFYYVVEDYIAKRAAYREEHLRLSAKAHERGELLLGGALDDPPDRALLVFRATDKSIIEDFIKKDPYVINGLVKHWEIRPWNVVVGREMLGE